LGQGVGGGFELFAKVSVQKTSTTARSNASLWLANINCLESC
jgi:hypothetical protein